MLETLQKICKACGDPLRNRVLRVLKQESYGVLELCSILSCPQSRMSHHLKTLQQAGLVDTRKDGTHVFYRRILPPEGHETHNLHRSLFEIIDGTALESDEMQEVSKIREERKALSLEFFEQNAKSLREKQDVIVSFDSYFSFISQKLSHTESPKDTCLEVGPGAGESLSWLSQNFGQVFALDNSNTMLEEAKRRGESEHLENVTFLEGEVDSLTEDFRVDTALINMVLHHVASPEIFLGQVAKYINYNGYLAIADLCPHEQEWARTHCGDLWLGLKTEDISQWAQQVGFKQLECEFLSFKNGFQVQIFLFQKVKEST